MHNTVEHIIQSLDEFRSLTAEADSALVYFSNDACNVCKVLKPKIRELLEKKYPKVPFYYVDIEKTPEIAGQNSIFTIPTILTFFGGNEVSRKNRYLGVDELDAELARPYSILFE